MGGGGKKSCVCGTEKGSSQCDRHTVGEEAGKARGAYKTFLKWS